MQANDYLTPKSPVIRSLTKECIENTVSMKWHKWVPPLTMQWFTNCTHNIPLQVPKPQHTLPSVPVEFLPPAPHPISRQSLVPEATELPKVQ